MARWTTERKKEAAELHPLPLCNSPSAYNGNFKASITLFRRAVNRFREERNYDKKLLSCTRISPLR